MATTPLDINSKPFYNTDQIANSIAADDMFDIYMEPVPGVGFVSRRRPGLANFANLATGKPGDGIYDWEAASKTIAVSDGKVFSLNEDGTFTELTGTKMQKGVPVVFADGQDTGGKPWLYMANGVLNYTTDGLTVIHPADPNTPKATHVGFLKSSFLANDTGTNRFLFTDTNPNTAQQNYGIIVNTPAPAPATDPVTIDTSLLRNAQTGKTWTQVLAITGTPTFETFFCPSFMTVTFSAGKATLAMTSPVLGDYPNQVTIVLTYAAGQITNTYSFSVLNTPVPLTIDQSSGTFSETIGIPFSHQYTSSGGTGVRTWTADGLPVGVSMSADGILSGTCTALADTAINITVTDSSVTPLVTKIPVIISASAQPVNTSNAVIIGTSIPTATIGTAYSYTFAATGAVGTLGWSVNTLPPGLVMSSTGVISGIPTGPAGITNFTVSVTDSSITGLFDNAYWSSTDNPLTCDAKGDLLAALYVAWQEVGAWGTQGLEVWQNDGVTPYSPIPGAFSECGIEAVYSIAMADNTIFALCVVAGARLVVKLQGRAPVGVSDAIGRVLADMPTVSDAIGDLVSVGGLSFYVLNFPTANQTWAYDYKNDVWSRWGYWNGGQHDQFIGQHMCFVKRWNKHLCMSRLDGKIYELRRDVFADAENPMVSFRRTGWINHGTYNRKICDQFYVKCKTGMSDNATLLIRWRDEGREEWGNYMEVTLSPIGVRDFLAKINRMGMYRSRQYEFRLTDNADLVLCGVDTELRGLSS